MVTAVTAPILFQSISTGTSSRWRTGWQRIRRARRTNRSRLDLPRPPRTRGEGLDFVSLSVASPTALADRISTLASRCGALGVGQVGRSPRHFRRAGLIRLGHL